MHAEAVILASSVTDWVSAVGFTERRSRPIGMPTDLHIHLSPPHENGILSTPCPCVSSRPGQLTEGSRCPSKQVPLSLILRRFHEEVTQPRPFQDRLGSALAVPGLPGRDVVSRSGTGSADLIMK
jgi:hypothetical protein